MRFLPPSAPLPLSAISPFSSLIGSAGSFCGITVFFAHLLRRLFLRYHRLVPSSAPPSPPITPAEDHELNHRWQRQLAEIVPHCCDQYIAFLPPSRILNQRGSVCYDVFYSQPQWWHFVVSSLLVALKNLHMSEGERSSFLPTHCSKIVGQPPRLMASS